MIDAHQHFWRYSPDTHGWIDASMAVLKRDFLPQDLKPLLDAAGASGCIAVQAAQTLDETRVLLELADENPWILGVVGWVGLESVTLESWLDEFERYHPRFVGARHVAQDEADPRFLVRPGVVAGIQALGRRGFAYDVLVREPQWPAALELVRALPDVRFVLDHLGKPPIRAGRFEEWRRWLVQMAAVPNVAAKLSGLGTEAGWTNGEGQDLRRWIDAALESFGPERLMIGSDWPVCLLATSYARALAATRVHLARLSTAEREWIESKTAIATYRLRPRT